MTDYGLAIRNFVGPGEVPDVEGLYTYAARAEALGFESLWAWDHILLGVEPSFPIIDSITTLGAVAARTTRIKLGTGVLVLPLRNPVVAAKALGSLDVISKGRLVLGVAAGWYAREFDAVGVPFKGRGKIFERNLGETSPLKIARGKNALWSNGGRYGLSGSFAALAARLAAAPCWRSAFSSCR